MPPRARTSQNIFMELRKICQHPYLVAPELENDSLSVNEKQRLLIQSSGKLAFLKVLLPKLKERRHRVLLFSQFKIALDWIQDFLAGEGYKFLRLDGDIQQAQRQKSMDAYNAPGSDYFIFLLTTRAGGVGINLATADTVIVYDPDFNPHQDLQAIARSHRYGQTKKVLVFKLMTKDSVEEQIVYNGKKKMVLDHLVVQNLGKDNEEEDVSSMLLAGAKALYETNADGTSASDVTYTSKQVEEMIDKVEKEAEDEAVVLEEKWEKEDKMTDEEKLAALNVKGSETMSFAFAKIWEMDKGDLGELDAGTEERFEDEMEDNWMTVWENAEKERVRRMEAEAQLNKNERRKRIDYAFDDTTPKKKPGRPKGAKDKNKSKESRETSVIRQFQSSDSEFHIGIGEGDDSADDSIDGEVPEGMLDLAMGRAATYSGLMKKKKSELNKMERRALRKHLEEEMKKAKESQAQSNDANGESTAPVPAMTSDSFFADLEEKAKKGTLNKLEKRARKKHLKQDLKSSHATSKSNLEDTNGAGPSTAIPNRENTNAGPSTTTRSPTAPMLVTKGQYTEVNKPPPRPIFTTAQAEKAASWAEQALKDKADRKARELLRQGLRQAMQEARLRNQAELEATVPPPTPAPVPARILPSGETEAERAAFREFLVNEKRLADREIEDIEREGHEFVHGPGTYPGLSSTAQTDADDRQEAQDLQRAIHESRSIHGNGSYPGPTSTPLSAQFPQQPTAGPSTIRPITPAVPTSNPPSRGPALVQMARTASQVAEIAKAQETMKWMWQHLKEFGLKKELKVWGRMVLAELPPAERKAIYFNLARTVDRLLVECGQVGYYSDARHKVSLETLFDQRAPGVEQVQEGGELAPRIPDGFGRLNEGQATHANTNGDNVNVDGHDYGNGQVAGPSTAPYRPMSNDQAQAPAPSSSISTHIARPAAQFSLQTPQQRAAMAKATFTSPQSASTVSTQPRQPSDSHPSAQPSGSTFQASNPHPGQGRGIDIVCPFCGNTGHHILACADRLARPMPVLKAQMDECTRAMADKGPSRMTAQELNLLHVRYRELLRLFGIQSQVTDWQSKQREAGRSPVVGNPPISAISAATPSSAQTAGEVSGHGIAIPARPQPRQSTSGSAVPSNGFRNGNGNGNGHPSTAGRSIDDAIAIDDDDDDNTISVAAPTLPPTPALVNAEPPTSAQWQAQAPTAPHYVYVPIANPPPPTKTNGASSSTNPSREEDCPMCTKLCGLDIKSCAEKKGGRKALKDRIRKMSTRKVDSEQEALSALYEVYQAWPREETPRKRVKRESA